VGEGGGGAGEGGAAERGGDAGSHGFVLFVDVEVGGFSVCWRVRGCLFGA
jgi:hypothetical protein